MAPRTPNNIFDSPDANIGEFEAAKIPQDDPPHYTVEVALRMEG
jgi:hypothetical protein